MMDVSSLHLNSNHSRLCCIVLKTYSTVALGQVHDDTILCTSSLHLRMDLRKDSRQGNLQNSKAHLRCDQVLPLPLRALKEGIKRLDLLM